MKERIFRLFMEFVVKAILEALDRDVKGLRRRIDNGEKDR